MKDINCKEIVEGLYDGLDWSKVLDRDETGESTSTVDYDILIKYINDNKLTPKNVSIEKVLEELEYERYIKIVESPDSSIKKVTFLRPLERLFALLDEDESLREAAREESYNQAFNIYAKRPSRFDEMFLKYFVKVHNFEPVKDRK